MGQHGVWYVAAPLTAPTWSTDPTGLPWRPWNDPARVNVEYELFVPKGTGAADSWVDTARRLPHSFLVAGYEATKALPADVRLSNTGQILGRWTLSTNPLIEGYQSSRSSWLWLGLLLVLVVFAILWVYSRRHH
jgi:hypothetical protein